MKYYTMTLQEIQDNSIEIFDFISVKPYADTPENSTARETYLKNLFKHRFQNSEIGFETVEMFKSNLSYYWNLRVQEYNVKWKALSGDIDITSNYKLSNTAENKFYDNPQSTTNELENFLTNDSKTTNVTSGFQNATEWEQIQKFNESYYNIDEKFIESFRDLFFLLY